MTGLKLKPRARKGNAVLGVFWGVVFSLPMWGGIAFAGYLVLDMLPGSVVPS